LSQSLGFSVVPPASTTTVASSLVTAPVTVSRQVTEAARRAPPTAVVVTLTANALGINVAAFPCGAHEPASPAVRAIGTYDTSVVRFALRLNGDPNGSLQPWKQ